MFSETQLTMLVETAVHYSTRVLGALVLLFIAMRVGRLVQGRIIALGATDRFDETLAKFLGSMAYWAIFVMSGIACLGIFGVQTTSFAAVIGAAGLAVGLAFQGSLSNLASGAMLLIFRPFAVGDVVTVAGETGCVQEIGLFTVTLDTPDLRRIILPNSGVFGGTIVNMSHHETRRVDVSVGCDYSAGLKETREALLKAAGDVADTVDEPQVVCTGLGASSVDWQVRVWVKGSAYFEAHERLTEATKERLDEVGIGIPYNTIDVNLTRSA